MNKLMIISTLLMVSSTVFADPTLEPKLEGSAFNVYATNTEDRPYKCWVKYTLTYTLLGEGGQADFHDSFYVRANLNRSIVAHNQTTFSNVKATNIQSGCG